MILTLEVTGSKAQAMGAGHRKVFKAIGGTIGRLPDNDWVFADPYVSGRHALIRYVNGKYFVEDTSTNGVFINSTDKRIARGQPQQLRDGDALFIDAYKINISIQTDASVESRDDPFAGLKDAAKSAAPAKLAPIPTPVPAEDETASLPMIDELASVDESSNHTAPNFEDLEDEPADDQGTQWFGVADIAARFSANAPVPQDVSTATPADLEVPVASSAPAQPEPSTTVFESTGVLPAHDSQLQILLDAAGIEGIAPSNETARTLGEILRVALNGTIEVVRMRERMKDDLRMPGTTAAATEDNPLKSSATVNDVVHNLLVQRNPTSLAPVEAFDDAYRDMRDHQVALQSALRLAFETMLAQFDPLRLQEGFDRQMKGSILGVPAKMRYWDLYRDKYGEQVKDAETSFRTLFGDAFARAYEEHLERLKKAARPTG